MNICSGGLVDNLDSVCQPLHRHSFYKSLICYTYSRPSSRTKVYQRSGIVGRIRRRCRDWVAEDCCMLSLLLAVPSCIYSFWHDVIPTSYFIFYTCFTNFLSRVSLHCCARYARHTYSVYTYVRACVLCRKL